MADSRTFTSVTLAVWSCVKSTSEQQQGTVYEPPNANQGTATTNTRVGVVILSFNFDPQEGTITYTIEKKPFIVTDDEIWNGTQATIDQCG